jgi:hypothetical protein
MKIITEKLKLKIISMADYDFLYDLLNERPQYVNISHKKMPTKKQHIKFINSKPYSKWYIILFENIKIGSTYLSRQDEIGLYIKQDCAWKGLEPLVLKQLIMKNSRSRYLINTNPKNKRLISLLKKNKFKLLQQTYEYLINN